MQLSRRAFTGGALGVALGSQLGGKAFAQRRPNLGAALAAIRSYGERHLRYFGLPGLTLGVATPDGFSTVLDFGFANTDAHTPIGPGTLFQIGSISKSFTAALLHQFAAERRFKLSDRIVAILPGAPVPANSPIEVQHLLDHVAGLADSPPLFAPGGLPTAYAPGAHWHYSNTGYELLGLLAQHLGGKPLDQLLEQRLFRPLGMARTRGALMAADRLAYAQGYEAADQSAPFARGAPLEPAAWVDSTSAAGSVASTPADMGQYLRSLASAAQGRGGMGLGPQQGKIFTDHAVPSDTPGMTYGNGLMHVDGDGRSYLHHTGGMVSFSSSFHVDVASGVGSFASTNLSAFAEYRPRTLTRFAVDALTNALVGKPLPSPARLDTPLRNAASYIGQYSGPDGSFEIQAAAPLTLVADGQSAPLQPWGGEIFRTNHPRFHQFSLMFERNRDSVTGASWGPSTFLKRGSAGKLASSDPQLARLAGRYVNDDPWFGTAMVVERGGRLWIGTETPMTRIASNLWRIGEPSWSPERASFANPVDGRPQTLIYSGEKFARRDT